MTRVVMDAGFRRVSRRGTFAWSVDVYARSTSQPK
jgi:hypothetical protein